jgi:thiamine pyrophosphokinase
MTYTLVVGAAPAEGRDDFYSALLSGAGRVVAADAAGEWCAGLGRVPDVVVGDFDSALPGAEARLAALGAEVVSYPCDKDETDLELAVDVARGLGDAPIVLTASFTRRVEHTLAAFGALARAGTGARAADPGWCAFLCDPGSDLSLELADGAALSLIALADAAGVTMTGTAWTLEGADLRALAGRGISNRAVGGPVRVSTLSGSLALVLGSDVSCGLY